MPQRNIGYDEAYLAQIREEKLHNMLAIEVTVIFVRVIL